MFALDLIRTLKKKQKFLDLNELGLNFEYFFGCYLKTKAMKLSYPEKKLPNTGSTTQQQLNGDVTSKMPLANSISNDNESTSMESASDQKAQFQKIIQSIFQQQNMQNFISHLNSEQLQILNRQTGLNLPIDTIDNHIKQTTGKATNEKNQINNEDVITKSVDAVSDVPNVISNDCFNSLARIKIEYNSSSRHKETSRFDFFKCF